MPLNSTFYRYVRRLTLNKTYCAYWLNEWCIEYNRTQNDLLRELGCDLETMLNVAMCLAPRTGRETEDINQVAAKFQVDPAKLARVLFIMEPLYGPKEPLDPDAQ